jgi:CheY-like chemotaxis protein
MSPKRILIIDDQDDIREVAALAEALTRHPDVILLDVMMPELDGPSTDLRLQESEATRSIPVIFLTAKVQPAGRRKLSDLGALGLIAKPFDPMRLVDDVAAIVGWS